MGMKAFAKMVGLSRCNGKEGKFYDGMDTFITLNLSRSRAGWGGNRPCFRLKMASKDGWSSSMLKLVVDVVDGPIEVTDGA